MGSSQDLQALTNDRLLDVLSGYVETRTKAVRLLRVLLLAALILGAMVGLPSPILLKAVSLAGMVSIGVIAIVFVSRAIKTQRSLDAAVAELRRRGCADLADGIALEPMDGTGHMPRILVAETAALVMGILLGVWAIMLLNTKKPSDAFMLLGVALITCFFASAGWMVVVLFRSGAFKPQVDRR